MQVVLMQEGSDLDALSSAYGLTILYPNVKIVFPNSLSSSALKAIEIFKHLLEGKIILKNQLEWKKVKKVYLTDSQNIPKNFDGKIVVYDHHKKVIEKGKNILLNIENTGSVTTIIVEILRKRRKKLNQDKATLLSLGIYEDTGSFKYSSTTERDIKALEFLMEYSIDFEKVRKILEEKFDIEDVNVMLELTKNFQKMMFDGLNVGITHYNGKYSKDISRILKYIQDLESCDAYFAVIGHKNKISIIGRSKSNKIDVADILSIFEGGGHPFAASAKVKGFDIFEVLEILKFTISENRVMIKDITQKEVLVIYPDSTPSDIQKLPSSPMYVVTQPDGKYLGILKFKVYKDLIKHGLKDEKIENFIEDVITLSYDKYLFEIIKILKNTDQDIFPVLNRGFLVGVVTRKNIIKTLFKGDIPFKIEVKPKERNVLTLLNKSLSKDIIQKLILIGEISQNKGFRAFLVGGIVRDMLLKRKNLDIDILVEGDATEIIREFGNLKGYSYFYYPEFLTGYVKTDDGLKIDFASSRREIYDYPGAYPRIEIASAKEDLLRRDFTINTLLIEITKDNFGILIDYFGAVADIKEKRIRVLHPVSFIEDPIRILRALRFSGRFDFKLEKTTEKLLKTAVDRDLLYFAPPGRVKLELELIFHEENLFSILKLMERYRILYYIFEMDSLDQDILRNIQKTKDIISLFKEFFNTDLNKTFIYSIILVSKKPPETGYKILKNYHFEREAKYLDRIHHYVYELNSDPEDIHPFLNLTKEIDEVVASVIILLKDSVSSKMIDIYRKVRNPIIKGEDLINLGFEPSPDFKKILSDVNLRFIKGEFKNKENCIKYIKDRYIKKVKDEDTDS